MHGANASIRGMKRLFAALAALAAAQAALAADKAPGFDVTLQPRATHEECVTLAAGDKRKYYWKTDGPVEFNVHYRQGPETSYPLKRDGMRGDGGTFTAKVAGEHCWTWVARDKRVRLQGRITD